MAEGLNGKRQRDPTVSVVTVRTINYKKVSKHFFVLFLTNDTSVKQAATLA
jgi:hypothetical protein